VRLRFWRAILNLTVLAVAVHSIALGIAFLFFPLRVLGLVGWEYSGPVFWPSQAGLLLVILGAGYAAAVRVPAFLWFVVGSKAAAFVFLLASAFWVDAPRIVGLLGCGDGLMGLAVAFAFWQVKRAEAGGNDEGPPDNCGPSGSAR
jgi:hypothetical protein